MVIHYWLSSKPNVFYTKYPTINVTPRLSLSECEWFVPGTIDVND